MVAMRGDPAHESNARASDRIVCLLFYARIASGPPPPQSAQSATLHRGIFPATTRDKWVRKIRRSFCYGKQRTQFGAAGWNNITNYTLSREGKALNKTLDVVVAEIRRRAERAVCVNGYELVESFINFYNPLSDKRGIAKHADGCDMSLVVQLLNNGDLTVETKAPKQADA